MTFYTNNLVELQVENSSICNAACPQCIRETVSSDKSWFTETYLSLDFFDKIPDEVYKQLKILYFNGSLGDPCAAPNFLEVCKLVRSKNPDMFIKISTNGGMKSPEFWTSLAEILGPKAEVVFAIDGLEDTNHIYRVNVRWDKLMKNVNAFISAGGKPFWQFIMFKHNEHQVEDAKLLAESMGFAQFNAKPSHRFVMDSIIGIERFNKSAIKIEPPTNSGLVHKVVLHRTAKNAKELMNQSNLSEITCHVKHTYSSAYIDHLGRLWPCCFLAAGLYVRNNLPVDDGWDNLWQNHGDEKINLKHYDWNSIINGDFFNTIQNSWKLNYKEGRLITCAVTCSKFQSRFVDPANMAGISKEIIDV
jgi:MoaA/NifB/PqqE/SkfB family radical SAM enzyme